MTLNEALSILADVHTRDDAYTGFVVMAGATWRPHEYKCSQAQYILAWETVRKEIHLQTEPEK